MFLVFDVGATFIKYSVMTTDGDMLEKGKTETPMYPEKTLEDFVNAITGIYEQYKNKFEIEGIAMDLPGQVDVEKGIVYNGGGLKYNHEAHLQDILSAKCDNIPVALLNDGHAAALAEVWKGNAKEAANAVVMVFGTGIGGGIIIDRKIYRGTKFMAGEISYCYHDMDIKQADDIPCMEDLPTLFDEYRLLQFTWSDCNSTRALCYRVGVAIGEDPETMTGERVYQLVDEGNQTVIDMMEKFYFDVARYVCNLYMILNPDVILIGGGISAEPRFLAGIDKYVKKLMVVSRVYEDLKLDVCKFLNDSNMLGALYNFKQKYGLLEE